MLCNRAADGVRGKASSGSVACPSLSANLETGPVRCLEAEPFTNGRPPVLASEWRAGPGAPRYACPVAALSKAELAAMAEEATVDAYGDDEQAMGFHAMIVDNLKVPFVTSVLGVEVTVEHIGLAEDNSMLAVCARGAIRQAVRLLDLPLPEPPPAGAEWIDGYRHWLG
jgi:hypothetical protein